MHKYLPEQRLAYVGMAVIMLMLIASGLVKTYKNIYAPDMSHAVLLWATWIHNIFFVLFFLSFLAHMAAIALRPNWPMVRGIFTGAVRLDYARHRHYLWIKEIEQNQIPAEKVEDENIMPAADSLSESLILSEQEAQLLNAEGMEDKVPPVQEEGKPSPAKE